ncbi:hypothetical protein ACFLZP_03595, partial [Patescibacteria group bacterium]
MKKEINFLDRKQIKLDAAKAYPFIQRGMIIFFIVYIFLGVGIVVTNLFLSQKTKQLREKINDKKVAINRLARVESFHLLIKDRLNLITKIIGKEDSKIGLFEAMERVQDLGGTQVEISSLSISDFGSRVTLRGSISEVVMLIDF